MGTRRRGPLDPLPPRTLFGIGGDRWLARSLDPRWPGRPSPRDRTGHKYVASYLQNDLIETQ